MRRFVLAGVIVAILVSGCAKTLPTSDRYPNPALGSDSLYLSLTNRPTEDLTLSEYAYCVAHERAISDSLSRAQQAQITRLRERLNAHFRKDNDGAITWVALGALIGGLRGADDPSGMASALALGGACALIYLVLPSRAE